MVLLKTRLVFHRVTKTKIFLLKKTIEATEITKRFYAYKAYASTYNVQI